MARKLIVEIIGDSTKLTRSFNQSTTAANKFGTQVSGSMGKAEKSMLGLQRVAAGGFIGAAALSGTVVALRKVLDVAGESQLVLGQTQIALESTGKSWEQYGDRIERAVAQQSRLGFDDEALLQSFSLFIRSAGSVDEALRRNNISMDVARARFIDLEEASKLVNKAALGQAGALRRVGIDTGTASTGIELLALLETKFAGAAEDASTSAVGAQDRLAVSVENLQEKIGSGLLPVITEFAKVTAEAADMATELLGVLGELGKVKIPTIVIPFTTREIGGGTFGGLGAKVAGAGALGFISPAALFAVAIKEAVDRIRGEPPPDREINQLAATFDAQFAAFTDQAVVKLNEAADKAVKKSAKAFGEKGFKASDANELGESLQRAFDATLDALDLKFDQAVFAQSTAGALAILDETEKTIRKRIKTEGRTTELLRDLFQVDQDRAAVIAGAKAARQERIDELARKRKEDADNLLAALEKEKERREKIREALAEALQRRQFRAIGLGPTGAEIVPGIENLRKQLEQLSKSVVGEDVPRKLLNRLAGVRKTLAGGFGEVTEETRSAINDLFATIRNTFDQQSDRGFLTKTTTLNRNRILEGLGLDPDTERALRARLSGINSASQRIARPGRAVGAFGQAFGPGGQPINITVVSQLDGEIVGRNVTRHQNRARQANPTQKRGANSGRA